MHEEILEKHPSAKLKVYAVWFNMIWTDARSRRPTEVLTDPRVVHFWDEEKVAGRWYEKHVTRRGDEVEWDAYFLYAPDVSWGEEPPEVVVWGRTILDTKQRFRGAVKRLFEDMDNTKGGKPDG